MTNHSSNTYTLVVMVILTMFGFSLRLSAQDTEPHWKSITEPREEIDFEMPGESFRVDHWKKEKNLPELTTYSSSHGNGTFVVFSTSDSSFLYFDSMLKFATEKNAECSSRLEPLETYECVFDEGVYRHKFKTMVTDRRAYILYFYSNGKADEEAERFLGSAVKARDLGPAKAFDRSIFANAFKTLYKAPPAVETGSLKTPVSKSDSKKEAKVGTGSQTYAGGGGSGISKGSGVGPGIGDPESKESEKERAPKPKKEHKQMKILSKPRPGYTQLARLFSIQGTVKLRVTFLTNGQIGSVTISESLPFGLTEMAIEAVRAITFEPERINGTPVSVQKTVVFNFTIY